VVCFSDLPSFRCVFKRPCFFFLEVVLFECLFLLIYFDALGPIKVFAHHFPENVSLNGLVHSTLCEHQLKFFVGDDRLEVGKVLRINFGDLLVEVHHPF
jgi:hypothetical protein